MLADTVGKYRLDNEIGAGAHGLVMKAYDTSLDRTVALKSLRSAKSSPTDQKELINEAKILARLNHANIVTLFELIEQDDTPFLVMEYVDGISLSARLKAGPLELEDALHITEALADALEAASALGIVHGDIKPSNIMLDAKGTPRLVDFGLAKFTNRDDALATLSTSNETAASLEGTLPYMAPESVMGHALTERADIFSLGAVLYEMITGKRAFDARSQGAILNRVLNDIPAPAKENVPDLPAWVDDLMMAMLHKEPTERTPSMASVRARLIARDKRTLSTIAKDLIYRISRTVQRRRSTPQWVKIAGTLSVISLIAWAGTIVMRDVAPPISLQIETGLNLVQHFDRKGAVKEAQEIFGRILADDPEHAAAQAGLALALIREYTSMETDPATLRRATAYANSALADDPHLALANIAAAWVAEFNSDFETAHKMYDMAEMLEHSNPLTLEGRTRTYKKQGNYDAATDVLAYATKTHPENVLFHGSYGDLLSQKGKYAEAEKVFKLTIQLQSDNVFGYANLAQAQHMQGKTREAISTIQSGLKIADNSNLYSNLGTYLFFQGQYAQATKAFERALEFEGNSQDYFYWANLADAYRWTSSKKSDAALAYKRAIQLLQIELLKRPNHPALNSRNALYNAKLGKNKTAQQSLNKIINRTNLYPVQLYRIAVTLEILGDRTAAIKTLDRAIDSGYAVNEIHHDPELEQLRQDINYQKLLTRKGIKYGEF